MHAVNNETPTAPQKLETKKKTPAEKESDGVVAAIQELKLEIAELKKQQVLNPPRRNNNVEL